MTRRASPGESDLATARLAAEIRRRRDAAQLSQPQLAAMVHYSRQYISMAEQPSNRIPSETLIRALDNALKADGALLTLWAEIEHAARLFRAWDDQFGGGLRRKAVVGQLSEVADELHDFSHPPDLTRRLFSVMAQLAETAATMSWDSGQGVLAQKYYFMSLRAAKEARDRAFGANILAGMARQQFYLGHISEGLELVRLAQDGVDGHATPTIRAMLHTREAWAYLQQGRLAAFRRATSRAEDCLRGAVPAGDPYWITYFDEAELAGVTGGRLLEVAHHRTEYAEEAAVHIGRAVQLRRPQSLRSAALDQLGLAEIRLIQGEPDEAAQLGGDAMNTVERTHSDRVRVKLVELYVATDAYAYVPSVADLRDRVYRLLNAVPRRSTRDKQGDGISWRG